MSEMETKGFGSFEIKDADKGEVTAIVATLGVVDRDGDVIMKGAIPAGGSKVKLSGYGHDVVLNDAPPVGIGTVREVGDKAVFDGRFFTTTERGREAFLTVKELGADGEWSFGFPKAVKTGELTDEWRAKGARRIIAGLLPVEASPVFRGAGRGTMTIGVKAASESLNDRMEAVHNALWDRNEKASGDGWYAREVFDDFVIVATGYRAGARLLRVPYTVDDAGVIALGDAVEVEVQYVPVEAKAAEEEPEVKAEEPEPEAESEPVVDTAAEARAADLKARTESAMEDYHRIQRTLRRLKVVA